MMDSSCTKLTTMGIYIWIYFTSFLTVTQSQGIHNIYSSDCSNERINLECPDFHKMAIKRLFYGTKNDTRCAGRGRQHSVDCCQPTHNDCLVVDDTKYPFLNMLCSGQRRCDIEAKSISSGDSCRAKGYGQMTNYMSIIHDCIPDQDMSYLCTDSHKQGKLLYLSNENYPHPISAGNQQCQCLIKTGSKVGLDIHALDIIITRSEATQGNQCYQDIELRDDDGHRKEITCGHPGLYAFRNIYNSDVRSVTLTLNNRAPKSQGYVWIQAKAREDDFVEIFCGKEMRRHLGYPVDDTESRTINDNGKPSTKDPFLDNGRTDGTANMTRGETPHVVSDMVALIVGVAVAVAMIIIIGLIGIIILCVRRSHDRKRPIRQEPPPFPSPMLKNKENDHTTSTYCRYDYDEDKYCSIKRSPMRMTKFSSMDMSADQKLKEAFSQGVSVPDSTIQNGYNNYGQQLSPSQNEPLLENNVEPDTDTEDELIMPKSEYIAIGKAIQPRSVGMREMNTSTLPEKKKGKNKTVTFSPVAMVTPLPSGSEESVPEDILIDDLKGNFLEMYSKSLPNRSSSKFSPDKTKKMLVIGNGTQDDMCLSPVQLEDCENVTEEDLWKDFNIKLSDNLPEPEPSPVKSVKPTMKQLDPIEDPDYDENPYDNLPYINIGSLRRHNSPDTHYNDVYAKPVKNNNHKLINHKPIISPKPTISQKPTIDTIPEGF